MPPTQLSHEEDDRAELAGEAARVVLTKADFLRALAGIRSVLAAYGEVLDKISDSPEWNREALVLVRRHREQFGNGESPLSRMDLVAGLFQQLLGRVNKEAFSFRIPTRVGIVPEAENPNLEEISRHLKALNPPTEGFIAEISALSVALPPEYRADLRELLEAITALLKGLIRQDWDDVALLVSHLHLITGRGGGHDLVKEIAHIARDIYNSFQELSRDFSVESLSSSTAELPDAVQKLWAVIEHLERAANHNLDFLEALNREAGEELAWLEETLRRVPECDDDLERLKAAKPEIADPLAEIQKLLRNEIQEDLGRLREKTQENLDTYLAMISSQSFQDLTGQTLKKVIQFVESLQFKLIEMLPHHPVGESAGEARKEDQAASAMETPVQSQEKVDQLLADLGF